MKARRLAIATACATALSACATIQAADDPNWIEVGTTKSGLEASVKKGSMDVKFADKAPVLTIIVRMVDKESVQFAHFDMAAKVCEDGFGQMKMTPLENEAGTKTAGVVLKGGTGVSLVADLMCTVWDAAREGEGHAALKEEKL